MIAIEIYRIRIGLHYSRHARVKGIEHLNFFELLIIMSLLLIAGIERNPGPASQLSDTSFSSSSVKQQIIEDKFSIVHYNVQSLANKIDLIESELRNFDVICISETWLDDRTSDEDIRRVDPGKYGRDLHIEFSRTIVFSVPALQHRVPVFRFILCLL